MTDNTDKENGVWDKVFFNLDDFGKAFAGGNIAAPNAYGPILFRFKPTALTEVIDVAICLQSPSAQGFNRERESLSSVDEVNDLFLYALNHPSRAEWLKFKQHLQNRFGSNAQLIEVSCTLPSGVLSFNHLLDIVVDPYVLKGIELTGLVVDKITETGLVIPIRRRTPKVSSESYNYLLLAAEQDCPPTIVAEIANSHSLMTWAMELEKRGGLALKNYYRYLQYLYEGTVLPIEKQLVDIEFQAKLGRYEIYDEYEDEEYLMSEETLLGFENHDFIDEEIDEEFDVFLDELDDYNRNWAESKNEGWFYSDQHDDNYATAKAIMRRL